MIEALTGTEELAVLLDEDLDVENGRFSWWHGYGLGLRVHTEITGYLVGLVATVDTYLASQRHTCTTTAKRAMPTDRWIIERAKGGAIPILISKPDVKPGSPPTPPVSSAQRDPFWTPSLVP